MSQKAAIRRRKQAKKRNRHLAKLGRPGLPKIISASKAAARLRRRIQKEQDMARNKSKGKH